MQDNRPLPEVTVVSRSDHTVLLSNGQTMSPAEFRQEFVRISGPDDWKNLPESKYKCEKCGVSTHRDDVMNLRCNRCEWQCHECRCEPVEEVR